MPSSTFSSKGSRLLAPTVALLALLAVYIGTLEFATRRVFDRASRIQAVLEEQMREATRLRPARSGQAKTVLIAGNSLLEKGVDFRSLNDGLGREWRAKPLYISNTGFADWRFGLVRLLDGGAQPDALILMLNPRQLMLDRVRGSYFAHYMMRPSDLPELATVTRLHRTELSGMLLARYSLFYGIRAELRNYVLGRLFPELPGLLTLLKNTPKARFDRDTILRESEARLRTLNSIASAYGVRFSLVLPPAPLDEHEAAVIEAGRRAGVVVLNPLPPGALPRSEFPDGLHANRNAATQYTEKFIPVLRDWLDSGNARHVDLGASAGIVRRQ